MMSAAMAKERSLKEIQTKHFDTLKKIEDHIYHACTYCNRQVIVLLTREECKLIPAYLRELGYSVDFNINTDIIITW